MCIGGRQRWAWSGRGVYIANPCLIWEYLFFCTCTSIAFNTFIGFDSTIFSAEFILPLSILSEVASSFHINYDAI